MYYSLDWKSLGTIKFHGLCMSRVSILSLENLDAVVVDL